jgi:hypothetical protein
MRWDPRYEATRCHLGHQIMSIGSIADAREAPRTSPLNLSFPSTHLLECFFPLLLPTVSSLRNRRQGNLPTNEGYANDQTRQS